MKTGHQLLALTGDPPGPDASAHDHAWSVADQAFAAQAIDLTSRAAEILGPSTRVEPVVLQHLKYSLDDVESFRNGGFYKCDLLIC